MITVNTKYNDNYPYDDEFPRNNNNNSHCIKFSILHSRLKVIFYFKCSSFSTERTDISYCADPDLKSVSIL